MSDPHDPWPRGAVQRWDLNEAHRREPEEPFHWQEGTRVREFPNGVEFELVPPEPLPFQTWHAEASLSGLLGAVESRPPEGLLWTLGRDGSRVGKPWRLRGPFHMLHGLGRITSLVAYGGVIERQEPQVLVAPSVRLTPLDENGKPTGPARVLTGVRDVIVSLGPVVEETAVALGHMARATMEFNVALKSFASRKILHAFYLADAVLMWVKGRPVWVHRSWVRPMPCWGLTRRQRAAQRRRKRRKA